MVPHDKESELSVDFQVLREKLNLDQKIADQAWESYHQIRARISLEGDQTNWLGCAVFVACRNSKIPQEHCISLTSLLRYSNLSLVQFFDKIKKWAEMTKLNEEFRQKITLLESKVNITYNTFHSQYAPVFIKIFNVPVETESRHNRNRKQSLMNSRSALCSTKRVFEFCWLMFITAKSENKTFDQSLVNSYQLLYALFDFLFQNAFLDERRDLFNPNFAGLPPNWIDSEYNLFNTQPPSIIEILYEHKEDLTDVQYCREYTLKSIIKGWIDKKILAVSGEYLTLLHSSVFDFNFSSLTKVYESFLTNNGDFDERIFLKEYFRQKNMETPTVEHISTPVSESRTVCKPFTTPLTCRQYLQPEQISDNFTSVSQNIARLKNILVGRGTCPSKDLINIFKSLNRDPTEIVNNRILELQTKYITRCKEELGSNSSLDETKNLNVRSNLIVTLAYKLLEDILKPERKNNVNVGPLIERMEFISSIFICSVEIVEFTFNNYNDKFPRKFPWSLKVFNVPAFQMIKIIEITIRATSGQLSRNVIKHLMLIEETSLESLMWKSGSELWKEISKENNVVPKFEDVALPHQINQVFNVSCSEKKENNPGLTSPITSAMETFQSPNNSADSLNKKNTFPDIKPGQSLLQNNHSTQIIVGSEGTKKVLQFLDPTSGELVMEVPSKPVEIKPKKGGTLGIILRKFYNLAGVRMFEICKALNITDFQQKIWTVLEYSVRETDLMKDRHLDQLLMCAVYVVCKLSQRPVQFADNIMKAYRAQPQATSDVYRKVNGEKIDGVYQELNLIQFYNNVYTEKVKDFALKFKISDKPQPPNHGVHLSPLPSEKVLKASPRTEILRNVFLKPYESPTSLINNEHTMNYCFNRSTTAELKEINATVNSAKRQLPEEFDLNRRNVQKQSKIAALCEERKVQRKEIKPTEPKSPPAEAEINFIL